MLDIYVDADACPVKDEVLKVAARYGLGVAFVSNSWMRVPVRDGVTLVVVDDNPDAADNHIAEHAAENDIVVTADIPLASRCIKNGAHVIASNGRIFTDDNIGDALATRNLLSGLREAGSITGGPPPFGKKDRARFLQSLDEVVQGVKRDCTI